MKLNFKPSVLIILDGFGISQASSSNAISLAQKPFFNSLIKDYPSVLLEASGLGVGLPFGEVGNSEVGHLTIGSGTLLLQNFPRINESISNSSFFELKALQEAYNRVKDGKGNLHLVGMIGKGAVHSSQSHLEALIAFAKEKKIGEKVFLHLFLDGRDTPKDAGKQAMADTLNFCKQHEAGRVATLGGRYYGMDRNKNWDRIQKAYDAIINGQSEKVGVDPIKMIEGSYASEVYDEELAPAILQNENNPEHSGSVTSIADGDSVIFFNFRADRARQLVESLVEPDFDKFAVKKFNDLHVTTFTEYKKDLPVNVLFPTEIIKNPLAKILADNNLTQLHLAETEKYAHVTFFLNGRAEKPFTGEERILIPSPAVKSYDEKPEMSAMEVMQKAIEAINSDKFDFMVINLANTDMVGHTGNLDATIKATETVDKCLSEIVPAVTKKGGAVFIVSDHGNAEEMFNYTTGDIDKEHNMSPVPFITVASNLAGQPNKYIKNDDLSSLTPAGILTDVAPTILEVIGLGKNPEMTGRCLIDK